MPAPFFCVSGCRAVFGISGAGVSERRCGRAFGGERRGRVRRIARCSEDCWALGGLPGARKTAGHSEDCRTLGGRERGLWELVRVSGAACKRLGGELSGIAGGDGLLAANCRGRRGGVSGAGMLGRGPLESEGVGCLEAICLAGTSLDAGKGPRVRRVAGCSGVGLKPGGGVPAFVGSRNRESRAYEGRRRGGNIRGAGISYEIPAPGWCLLT